MKTLLSFFKSTKSEKTEKCLSCGESTKKAGKCYCSDDTNPELKKQKMMKQVKLEFKEPAHEALAEDLKQIKTDVFTFEASKLSQVKTKKDVALSEFENIETDLFSYGSAIKSKPMIVNKPQIVIKPKLEQDFGFADMFDQEKAEEDALFEGVSGLFTEKTIYCLHCKLHLSETYYKAHAVKCMTKKKAPAKKTPLKKVAEKLPQKPKPKNLKDCYYCPEKIESGEHGQHIKDCEKIHGKFDTDRIVGDTRMTQKQLDNFEHMLEKTKKEHEAAIPDLVKKVVKLGYKEEDVFDLLEYFEHKVPLVVHIHIHKHMQFFVKDTNYRNQFETNKSSGSTCRQSRTGWEKRMFDDRYTGATHFERVKYGTINCDKNIAGVSCASGYGQSYLVLKNDVRYRCTFTEKDSSNSDSKCGTLKYCAHVLNKFNDNEMKAVMRACKGLDQDKNLKFSTYKELQIHGPLEFAVDIEKLCINEKQVKGKDDLVSMSIEFAEKNKIPAQFF